MDLPGDSIRPPGVEGTEDGRAAGAWIRRALFFAFRLAILGISLFVLSRLIDVTVVLGHVREIPVRVVALILALAVFGTWLTGIRWRLLNPDVTGQLSSFQYFRFLMISNAFNLVMPGALGGDFVRGAMTMKAVKNRRADNLIAIVVDRFIGLFSTIVIGSLALLFMSDIPGREGYYRIFGVVCSGFITVILLAVNPRVLGLAEKIMSRFGGFGARVIRLVGIWRDALVFFRRDFRRVVLGFLISLPVHGISFFSIYILARQLDLKVSFFDICLVFALVWVITAIPVTISGAGVRELSLIYLMAPYGVTAEAATALAAYSYAIAVFLGVLGLFFLLGGGRRDAAPVRGGG